MRGQRGFTLVEMAVVIAIVGVLASLAVSADPEDQASSDGFADQLVADLDQIRLAAMSTRRWHRLTVNASGGTVEQATTIGMATPADYDVTSQFVAPHRILIDSVFAGTQVDPTGDSPGSGEGFDLEIKFAPDGTSTARTIYITDVRGRSKARVAIFAATGLARAYSGW